MARHIDGEVNLDDGKYELSLENFQKSNELLIKGLLDFFNVKYNPDHDLTIRKNRKCLGELYQKFKKNEKNLPYSLKHIKKELATAFVWMRILSSIKEFLIYAEIELKVPALTLFNENFKNLAIETKKSNWQTCNFIRHFIEQVKANGMSII